MKKLLTIFAVLLTALSVSADVVFYDFYVGGIDYNILSEEDLTCEVADYPEYSNENAYRSDVVIPTSVTSNGRTFTVTAIGDSAFYGCTKLTSVKIPNSVTTIGGRAFYECQKLTSVVIGNSVTTIGDQAFRDCSSLTSVVIGNSVTTIGREAFYNCSSLTSVYISDLEAWCKIKFVNLTSNPLYYAHNLYLNGEVVTDLEIPNSVTEIGYGAFYNCKSLTSVEIPNSVTTIGWSAFYGCSGLTSVVIGNSVTTIGDQAFRDCSSLTSVVIGNSVTTIGEYTFYDCSSLTSVVIGNSVTTIGKSAFCYCSGLTSVEIPNSVTTIGIFAFCYCSGLTSVEIGNSVTKIGGDAFYDCSSLTSVYISDLDAWCKISFDGYYSNPLFYAHNLYLNGELVTDLEIPNSVTTIGNYAFFYCSCLTSVEIPSSVVAIGTYAFYGCNRLRKIKSFNAMPPYLADRTFPVSLQYCVLKVPFDAVNDYKAMYGWKEFTHIVSLEDDGSLFDTGILYYLNTDRGYLPNHKRQTGLWGENYIVSTESKAEMGRFQIICEDGNYKFFNVDLQEYLLADGTPQNVYSAEPDGTFSIIPGHFEGGTKSKWIIKSNVTGKWMMFGGGNQLLNNDDWATADEGDQWTITPVSVATADELQLNKTELALDAGDSYKLTTTVCGTVTWTSSNTDVATVSAEGLVTGVRAGTAVISAICGSVGATCIVTVTATATQIGIYADDTSCEAGKTVRIAVKMTNDVEVASWQLYMVLPDGFTVATDPNDSEALLVELATERTTDEKHNALGSSINTNGDVVVTCASTSSKTYATGDGDVCYVTLNVGADVALGTYSATIKDPVMTKAGTNESMHPGDHTFQIEVVNPTGISSFADESQQSAVYNIVGLRVGTGAKGVIIKNGKKYVNK